MKVKVTMLNVKDGDAIIIELTKPKKALVMVIDSGEPAFYKTKMKPKLEAILKVYNKKAPDIVVCTHYDSDHIGGLIPLIQDYISEIKEVWIHKTPLLLKASIENDIFLQTEITKSIGDLGLSIFKGIFKNTAIPVNNLVAENANIILRSLPQLKRLIDLIPPSKLKQVFHKQNPLTDWPEITIMGPTKSYYDSLFPKNKTFEQFIIEEAIASTPTVATDLSFLKKVVKNPCDLLKKDGETKLTATNKASILLAIDKGTKRYLFTGDAGIESFKSVPDWQKELRNLYFLKIPHHASNNNISKELVELMQPMYAYTSGLKYQDEEVLQCFAAKKRNKEVKTTKTDGDLVFEI